VAHDRQELWVLTMIKIDFEFDSQYGKFADALHLPEDHGLSDAQIEALKQERLDNWLAILNTPQEPVDGE
jgi:hypothetical protein